MIPFETNQVLFEVYSDLQIDNSRTDGFQSSHHSDPVLLSSESAIRYHDDMNNQDFLHHLIKGNIAEMIFAAMISEAKRFIVLPTGYEHTVPVVAQSLSELHNHQSLHQMRSTPDFLLVSRDNQEAFYVEVKYRSEFHHSEVIELATKLEEQWSGSYLFLATQEGFFLGKCSEIISEDFIKPLDHEFISTDTQAEYLLLLKDFIKPPSSAV